MTNSQQARPMTPDENFRELYKRVAKLNDAVSALLNPAWGSEMGLIPSGHPLHQGEAPSGTAATKPTRFVSDIRAAEETAGMVRATGTLREQIATAVRSVLYQDLPGDMGQHVADAVLLVLLPGARITATLARDSEATVQRVIDMHERWVKTGPPPLGTPMARWWDRRLAELHNAILQPAAEQPTDETDTDEALRAKVDEATTTLRRIRALHARTTIQTTNGPADVCATCESDGMSHLWPCTTAEALAGPRPDRTEETAGCRCHNGDELCSGCRRCPDVCHGCDGPKYQTKEQ